MAIITKQGATTTVAPSTSNSLIYIGAALVLVLIIAALFVRKAIRNARVEERQKIEQESAAKVQELHKAHEQFLIDSVNLETKLDNLQKSVDHATQERIEAETEGKTIREKAEIVYREIEKKVTDPSLTNEQRIALTRHIMRTRTCGFQCP
jgi:flagellar biosynthesis/type III secretory pathway M-ring protein FliF/YscJ